MHDEDMPMSRAYNNAMALFRNVFGITMTLDIARDLYLTPRIGPGCSHWEVCCLEICGSICYPYPYHCKSGLRKLGINATNTEYTLRIVGYFICAVDEVHSYPLVEHRSVGGLGQLGGRNTIVSNFYAIGAGEEHQTLNAARIFEWLIQHELGHNFGAWDDSQSRPDNRCSENQRCTMRRREDVGFMCANCRNDMWQHLFNRYG